MPCPICKCLRRVAQQVGKRAQPPLQNGRTFVKSETPAGSNHRRTKTAGCSGEIRVQRKNSRRATGSTDRSAVIDRRYRRACYLDACTQPQRGSKGKRRTSILRRGDSAAVLRKLDCAISAMTNGYSRKAKGDDLNIRYGRETDSDDNSAAANKAFAIHPPDKRRFVLRRIPHQATGRDARAASNTFITNAGAKSVTKTNTTASCRLAKPCRNSRRVHKDVALPGLPETIVIWRQLCSCCDNLHPRGQPGICAAKTNRSSYHETQTYYRYLHTARYPSIIRCSSRETISCPLLRVSTNLLNIMAEQEDPRAYESRKRSFAFQSTCRSASW